MPRSINPVPQFLDSAGDPLAYGLMYFFDSGTNDPKTTYKDANLTIENTHPVVLNADGTMPNVIYEGSAKQILTDANAVQRWERDPVGSIENTFGNPWSEIIIYSLGEVVRGTDGVYYESVGDGNQGNDPVTTSGFWKLLYSIQWSAAISYQVNASVLGSDGILYTSLIPANLNNDPISSPNEWANPATIDWSALVTYAIDANVRGSDGVLYQSLAGTNLGNDPTSDPTKWSVAATMAWQSGFTYAAGANVTASDGAVYIAISGSNTGNDPVSNLDKWAIAPTMLWQIGLTYLINANVTGSDGIVYRSLAGGNTGNDPTSVPASWVPAATIDYQATTTYAAGANVTENDVMFYSKVGANVGNLPSTSPTEWGLVAFQWYAAQTYGLDANVIGSDGLFYQSAIGSNIGNDPTSSPTQWFSVMALVGSVVGTSTSSVLVGTGAKTWTTQTGLAFAAGNNVKIVDNAAPATNFMVGTVTSYTTGTGVIIVEVSSSTGAGTLADWTITVNSVQIDDVTPSTSTVYSSTKTESLVADVAMQLILSQTVTVATTFVDFASLVNSSLYSSYVFIAQGFNGSVQMQFLDNADAPITTNYAFASARLSEVNAVLVPQTAASSAGAVSTALQSYARINLGEGSSEPSLEYSKGWQFTTSWGGGSTTTSFTLGGLRFLINNGATDFTSGTFTMYGILK